MGAESQLAHLNTIARPTLDPNSVAKTHAYTHFFRPVCMLTIWDKNTIMNNNTERDFYFRDGVWLWSFVVVGWWSCSSINIHYSCTY